MQVQVITITPDIAQKMLQKNDNNRKLSEPQVKKLVNAISNEEWVLNGESIKFDKEGKLLDGQHRLMAVIRANKPIVSMVVNGIDKDANQTIDTGRKRSPGDVLGFNDVKNPVAAIIAKWKMLEAEQLGRGNTHLTNAKVVELYKENEDVLKRVVLLADWAYSQYQIILRSTIGGIAMHLIHIGYDESMVGSFIKQVSTGETNYAHIKRFFKECVRRKSAKVQLQRSELDKELIYCWEVFKSKRMGIISSAVSARWKQKERFE